MTKFVRKMHARLIKELDGRTLFLGHCRINCTHVYICIYVCRCAFPIFLTLELKAICPQLPVIIPQRPIATIYNISVVVKLSNCSKDESIRELTARTSMLTSLPPAVRRAPGRSFATPATSHIFPSFFTFTPRSVGQDRRVRTLPSAIRSVGGGSVRSPW